MPLPRILTSAKFQAALGSAVLSAIPLIFTLTDPGLTRAQKQESTTTYIKWVMGVFGAAIVATGVEDAADKYNPVGGNATPKPTAPSVQVNTGSGAENTQTTATVTPPADDPPTAATGATDPAPKSPPPTATGMSVTSNAPRGVSFTLPPQPTWITTTTLAPPATPPAPAPTPVKKKDAGYVPLKNL